MDGAGPDLLRPDAGEIDRRGAVHARGLRRVGVELVARDHLDAMGLPIGRTVLVGVAHWPRPVSRMTDPSRFLPTREIGVDTSISIYLLCVVSKPYRRNFTMNDQPT